MGELSFGEWLKRRRKSAGLTQEQLAQQIGCAAITLRKIEAEERRPSVQIVERLSTIFRIPQKEQALFQKFARGGSMSASIAEVVDAPWDPSHVHSYIPIRLNQLIGREQDTNQVCEYLANPGKRLVTLSGPPGVGKTSLSQQVAKDSTGVFGDGVFFIALAPLLDPDLVASTVRQTLRYEGRGKSTDLEILKDGIADKQMLLVLDNFEHVLEAASLVPELLLACPRLKILVTSREALRVPGEWIYSVPPLSVPSRTEQTDWTAARDFPALSLFAERAQAVRSEFKLNSENTDVITTICSRLDGLPLAIELIAARIRHMSPRELLSRMDQQFVLQTDGMRAIQPRQRTLNNSIVWSYDLLTHDEQSFFAQLGVFSGSFTVEGAAQVTGIADALRSINTLLDKSLLQRVASEQDQTRFTFLFTIREFALHRLNERNETARLRNQHLQYFLGLAKKADQEIHGPHQVEWLDHFEIEHDNYRAALAWCISSGSTKSALDLIGCLSGLGRFWSVRSYFSEARSWFDKVRATPSVQLHLLEYATALNGMSFIAGLQGDGKDALDMVEESRRICERLGTDGELGLAGALLGIGLLNFWFGGDLAYAEACYEKAAAIYKERGSHWEQALSYLRLGVAASARRNFEKSRVFLEESLNIFRQLEDAFGLARVYSEMGALFYSQGDYTQARRMNEQRLGYDRKLRFQTSTSGALVSLGVLCRIQGDYDQAEKLFEEAMRICYEFNLPQDNAYFYLGCVNLYRSNFTAAETLFMKHLKVSQEQHLQINFGDSLLGLGAVASGQQNYERAARLAGAGQAVHDATEWRLDPNDRIEIDPRIWIARDQLGDEHFERFFAQGRLMTMEQAAAYALEDQ